MVHVCQKHVVQKLERPAQSGLKQLKVFPGLLDSWFVFSKSWWFQIFFIFIPTWGNDPI